LNVHAYGALEPLILAANDSNTAVPVQPLSDRAANCDTVGTLQPLTLLTNDRYAVVPVEPLSGRATDRHTIRTLQPLTLPANDRHAVVAIQALSCRTSDRHTCQPLLSGAGVTLDQASLKFVELRLWRRFTLGLRFNVLQSFVRPPHRVHGSRIETPRETVIQNGLIDLSAPESRYRPAGEGRNIPWFQLDQVTERSAEMKEFCER